MSLKNWLLHKMNGIATRPDLPRSPVLHRADAPAVLRRDARRAANGHIQSPPSPPPAPHLGPYAPLVNAIREELESFVVSHLRLHLAIAERDRYVLTSIDVRAATSGDADELLRRFMREFKPEQIKHYLEKEIIGALPNASAIDLAQFAGLNAARDDDEEADDDYSELLAELKSAKPGPKSRPFEVSLIGRWSEHEPGTPSREGTPRTPLAGRDAGIAIEDADGARHVVLRGIVPGRRYAIGKGEACDVVVNGVYASRRHCEIWFDRDSWWVTDAGSTNGVRVERGSSVLGRSASSPGNAMAAALVEITAGSRIVLSAHTEGPPSDYPCIVLEMGREAASAVATPIAPAIGSSVTPSTPIIKTREREGGFVITARTATGVHTVDLSGAELPFSVGRSRSQALVIDWAHEGVSGHHADITEIDPEGVTLVVHGDNGLTFKGKSYPPGARLRWQPGDSITLGRTIGSEPQCHLTLSRHA